MNVAIFSASKILPPGLSMKKRSSVFGSFAMNASKRSKSPGTMGPVAVIDVSGGLLSTVPYCRAEASGAAINRTLKASSDCRKYKATTPHKAVTALTDLSYQLSEAQGTDHSVCGRKLADLPKI